MSRTWKIYNGTLRSEPVVRRSRVRLFSVAIVTVAILIGIFIANSVKSDQSGEAKAGKLNTQSPLESKNVATAPNNNVVDSTVFFSKKSKAAATYSILEKWGVNVDSRKRPQDKSIKKIASRFKFKQFYGPLAMKSINGVGYPVIFEIKEGTSTGYVPVVGVWGKQFITNIDMCDRIDKEWVFQRWTGNVHILWKNYKSINRVMKRGSRGKSVKWLHSSLSELGYANLGSNGYYGRITERAVLMFQSNNAIEGVGEAGPLTMMLLYKYLPEYKTPGIVFDLG